MLIQYSPDGEIINCKFHCRIGLQGDALTQPVEINTCYPGHLIIFRRFFFNYGCKRRYFHWGKVQSIGRGEALIVPEYIILPEHPAVETFRIEAPVKPVSYTHLTLPTIY